MAVARFQFRRVVIEPGADHPYDEDEWHDALVVVEAGGLELQCCAGSRRRFGRGDVLWLTRLPLRALHNPGAVPTVLVAVSRLATGTTDPFDPEEMIRA